MTLPPSQLASFTFELFDFNNNNLLDKSEINLLIKIIWGKEKYESNRELHKALQKLEWDLNGQINKDAFIKFTKRFQFIIQPAIQMQLVFRRNVCGDSFWDKLSKQRLEDHGNKSIFEILGIGNDMYKKIEKLAAKLENENIPQSLMNNVNNAKKNALDARFREFEEIETEERKRNAEIMKQRKKKQMKSYDVVIRRLTVTASDIKGNKFHKYLATPQAKPQFGDVELDKSKKNTKKPNDLSYGKRMSHIVLKSLGVKGTVKQEEDNENNHSNANVNSKKENKKGVVRRLSHLIVSKFNTKKGLPGYKDERGKGNSGKKPISDEELKKKGIIRRISHRVVTAFKPKQKNGNGNKYSIEELDEEKEMGDNTVSPEKKKKSNKMNINGGVVKRMSILLGLDKKKKNGKVIPVSDGFSDIGDD